MSKGTQKKAASRDRIKTQVVAWIAQEYKVDKNYIYAILRGDFNYGIAEEVKKDYAAKYAELESVLS